MCVYSAIMDTHRDWWNPPQPLPVIIPDYYQYKSAEPFKPLDGQTVIAEPYKGPTKEQMQELIELLRAAKKYDDATGQPDCEVAKKKAALKAVAEALGITDELP
jgi:hypothetical protein